MAPRRSRIIVIGILLGLVGAIIPIAAMSWVSWQIAQRNAFSVLDAFSLADRTLLPKESQRNGLT